ncbi:MAG TPA: putative zinc-binding metallopeptidase [Gemmataceae bacterium]|nr:putative zinc-binding metallopeptidase [Gemmataceae bacterium]
MTPWEDWAETRAHYLHMIDTPETAAASGVRLRRPRKGEPVLRQVAEPMGDDLGSFAGRSAIRIISCKVV